MKKNKHQILITILWELYIDDKINIEVVYEVSKDLAGLDYPKGWIYSLWNKRQKRKQEIEESKIFQL